MDDYLFDSALSYRQGLVEECHHKEIQLHEATFEKMYSCFGDTNLKS